MITQTDPVTDPADLIDGATYSLAGVYLLTASYDPADDTWWFVQPDPYAWFGLGPADVLVDRAGDTTVFVLRDLVLVRPARRYA